MIHNRGGFFESYPKPPRWGRGEGGGGHSHIWPIRVCATEQCMVFKVLSLKIIGYTILLVSVFNRVSFWTGSLSKSVNTCDDESTLATRFFTMDPKRVNVASSNSKQF